MEPRVLAVILNYRTPDMTLESAAAAVREMEGIAGEVVIVDNDSRDGSEAKLVEGVRRAGWEASGRVRVIQSGVNGGYGAGNNVGIRAGLSDGSRPDYIYVLNSDAFPDAGAIRMLLDHMEANPDTAFAGSFIHGPDGDPHTSIFRFPSIWSEFETAIAFGPVSRLLKRYIVPMDIPDDSISVDWVSGASLMLRQAALDQVGLFDEHFFLYFEETDLCRRAREAGWGIDYVRESSVTHIGSVTTGMKTWRRTPRFWFDSRLYYFVKNHGPAYAAVATLFHVIGGSLRRVRGLVDAKVRGQPKWFLRDLILHDLGALLTGRAAPEPAAAAHSTPPAAQAEAGT